jgi:uncharacterized protein YcaQ
VGDYPRQTLSRLLREGRVFEFWAHQACFLPVEDWPLHRSEMTPEHRWRGDALRRHRQLADEVRAAIRERGPLTSREFEGRGDGGMWGWKPAKIVLEALWNNGEIVISGRVSGFQRLYDLPERVLPREVLDAPAVREALAGFVPAIGRSIRGDPILAGRFVPYENASSPGAETADALIVLFPWRTDPSIRRGAGESQPTIRGRTLPIIGS